jgi:hypothetical protein
MLDLDALNERSVGKFPGFLGGVFTYLDGTARQGTLASLARAVHRGSTTQVWMPSSRLRKPIRRSRYFAAPR